LTTAPAADEDDGPGEFTVYLEYDETELLETGDVFDIKMSFSGNIIVWTVLQGSMNILEDVTG
jgi:hypothetical protein